ncbi:MAG: hypothetical protein HC925_00515 [Coleofasciculaceae cyanobacterium SM2_3_26]|nr:hypothetical protein [Coleofasciculaceae cyanobacterium SM2_3_26]
MQALEREFQILREGNVALRRGELLAFGVVRAPTSVEALQAVSQLLLEANRTVLRTTLPGVEDVNRQAIEIRRVEVEQLARQIGDGREYIVRVLSAANYLRGETGVRVVADFLPNRIIFFKGDILANLEIDPKAMPIEEVRQRIDLLLLTSQLRARNSGMVQDTIQLGDGSTTTFLSFLEGLQTELQQYDEPITIRAVASEVLYTAGPLRMELVAMRGGEVVARTG